MQNGYRMADKSAGLTGDTLKMIAMVTMFIDHIGAVILERVIMGQGALEGTSRLIGDGWWDILYYVTWGSRVIGRIAFPIYCFLLVEGFLHTRDWRRYWLRLAVFAVISEVPFDLAVWNGWTGQSRNVFFELAAGLLVLQGLKICGRYRPGIRMGGSALVIGAGCLLALILRADYDADGILIISAYYLLKDSRSRQALWGGALGFLESWNITYGAAALSSIPILYYNGSKGNARHKYLFYFFYPAHLLLLFAIRRFVIGIPLS